MEVKTMGSTHKLLSKLLALSSAEVGGIPGVAVECVDIGRNTSGEGDLLGTTCLDVPKDFMHLCTMHRMSRPGKVLRVASN